MKYSLTILSFVLLAVFAIADTPPPGTIVIKGATDNTKIGNVSDALKVNVVNGGGTSTVNQGSPGPSPWPVTAYQGTSPWAISASSLPLPTGAATSALQSSTITALGSPFQAGGSIGNTAFGISGTLPAYSSTPTFNVGTTGGLALDSTLSSLSAKFGSLGQKTMSGSAPVVIASDQSAIPVTGTITTSPNVNVHDSSGGNINSTSNALNSFITNSSIAVTGTFWQTTQPVSGSLGRTWTLSHSTDSLSSWLNDGNGNALTSQANGSARALDVGIDVSGAQIDPRQIRALTSSDVVTANAGSGTFSISGTVTANAGTNLNTSALNLETTQSGFKSANHTDLTTINSTLGTPMQNSGGSVTANAGTNLNTSALNLETTQSGFKSANHTDLGAINTSVGALQVTQGSTTSGQSGTLIQGAVATNQPSYTNGQTSPLSLTLRGGLRSKSIGLDSVFLIRNNYSTTNVTTSAYVQLIASTSSDVNRLYIFDSSGQDLTLATGGSGSEVDQIQISPGGWNMSIDLYIPSGTRISIKSQSATASSGILLITGLR